MMKGWMVALQQPHRCAAVHFRSSFEAFRVASAVLLTEMWSSNDRRTSSRSHHPLSQTLFIGLFVVVLKKREDWNVLLDVVPMISRRCV